jgi:CRP-like cAMP-binding protein
MAVALELLSGNRLLAAVPPALISEITSQLEPIDLIQGDVLLQRGQAIDVIYFPTTGLISMVVDLHNGSTVESLTVGKDGFVETAAFFGLKHSTLKGIVQIGGRALVLPLATFEVCLRDQAFREVMGGYIEEAMALLAQSSACLAFHPVERRLARWLLEVQERIEENELRLTHEFLAQMLGVQRPTATIAVNMLVKSALIEHRRGRVRIVDQQGLEAASCECYRATHIRG